MAEERRPDPDPTVLTTQQVQRETGWLRELLETRLDAMDKALGLIQAKADKVPSETDVAVARLKELHDEKFKSIALQFVERDVRTEQTSRDSKVAVDAALQAAKEAVGEQNKSSALAIAKSEAATTKQIDQIGLLIAANSEGMTGKIEDVKQRLSGIESRLEKNVNQAAGGTQTWGIVSAIISAFAALIAISVGVAILFSKASGGP